MYVSPRAVKVRGARSCLAHVPRLDFDARASRRAAAKRTPQSNQLSDSNQNALVRKARAALGSLVFLVLVPGVVAGVVPWWLTEWQVQERHVWIPLQIAGWILLVGGVAVLLDAFMRFVLEGLGTPAPVAPPERLVVGGLYRYVRNPMYLAVAAIIVGQALVLGQSILLLYTALFAVAVATFVHWYEEPTLRRQFGEQYETYRRAVPAWWPRRKPWD
jgi:protein-S-isoprenylcysteine O-methyltransferase Ste14